MKQLYLAWRVGKNPQRPSERFRLKVKLSVLLPKTKVEQTYLQLAVNLRVCACSLINSPLTSPFTFFFPTVSRVKRAMTAAIPDTNTMTFR